MASNKKSLDLVYARKILEEYVKEEQKVRKAHLDKIEKELEEEKKKAGEEIPF